MPSEKQQNNIHTDDLAAYYFHQGTTTYAYDYLGAHYTEEKTQRYWTFRTWAPRAHCVELVGDFNDWGRTTAAYPMTRVTEAGVWECTVTLPAADKKQDSTSPDDRWEGKRYKYRITGDNGVHLKADPYGIYSESLQNTASILYIPPKFEWHDRSWRAHRRRIFSPTRPAKKEANADLPTANLPMTTGTELSAVSQPKKRRTALRSERAFYPAPMNIYEVHLGSFRTREGMTTKENPAAYLNYREIAEVLVPYVKEMGYTHVELLPIMEHPFDGSWGYQVCSYYAPTSRFGTPEDFKYFVDACHTAGIGVILDWVPAHFPKDEHGLYEFDGTPCYEYQGKDRMEHEGWGTRCFDLGRPEVQSFLVSNAMFWLREYHVDGLRCDAVAAMLYLDFDRRPGEWNPNPDGSNINLAAEAFFRKLNTKLFSEFPDALMIAEESSDWPMITKPVDMGGLGFNFKWNMGWANDLFDYVETDPLYRKGKHERLTFPLMYAFSENYILPVSHDEVVHGKKSLLDKMFGEYEEKFAGMRAFLAYMYTQPGKKMTFMGCEYAPFREWDYENQLEWFMLDYEKHKKMQDFAKALNHLYLERRELWEDDFSWAGYRWIGAEEYSTNTISYIRYDRAGNPLLVAVNFSPVPRENYPLALPAGAPLAYEELFSTDDTAWGGEGTRNDGVLNAEPVLAPDGSEIKKQITITLPGMSAVILAPYKKKRKK
ncbi:MAG: 1,4-alpha-glucan branching protein GlgB [Clostridia bacterium]|nr:1,4-alpha-glucan branching protein GlgB [Clostridia bacterium]